MNLDRYHRYLAAFNGRDYDTLHGFFSPDVVLQTLGYEMRGKAGIRRFYDFFHAHVRETVMLRRFIEGRDGMDFADVVIRFEGLQDLTAQALADHGYARMTPVPKGGIAEIDFFITYEQGTDGLIRRIRCGIFQPPAALP